MIRTGFILSAGLGIVAAAPALAQESGQQDFIEEIITTAQKREQNLQNIPISIQAVTDAQISELGAAVISDLESVIPSLHTGGIVGSSNQYMGIRGIVDFSRNPGIDARMGVYIDGIYQGRSYTADQPLLGLDRVEVLRGPQGTLFGKNTVSGAINLVTKTPGEDFQAEIQADAGNFGYVKGGAYVSGGLGDKIFASASVAYDGWNGYETNPILRIDTGDYERTAARAKLRLLPSDDLELILAVDMSTRETNAPFYTSSDEPPFQASQNIAGRDKIEFRGWSLTLNYDLVSGHTVTSLTGFRRNEYTLSLDDDLFAFDIQQTTLDEAGEQLSQELLIASPRYDRFDWAAGLYYLNMENSTERFSRFGEDLYNILIPALTDFSAALQGTIATPHTVTSVDIAAFFHGNYRFSETLELTAGARFTDSEKTVAWQQINSPADPATAATLELATGLPLTQAPGALFGGINYPLTSRKRTGNDVSPMVGLNWFLADNAMLYGKYSRGFKSGGFNSDFVTSGLDYFEYDDEFVDSYELGLKSTLAGGHLQVNATLFNMEYQDYQVFQYLLNAQGQVSLALTNAAEATSQGIEIETHWFPTDRLELRLNTTWLNAEYDKFENPGDPSLPSFAGNKLSFAPEWKTYVSAQYSLPIGKAGNLRFFVDHAYVDKSFSDPSNDPSSFRMGSYALTNARISWYPQSERWELAAWGRNLTDETYNRVNNRNFLQFDRTIWGAPRTYGISFRWFAR